MIGIYKITNPKGFVYIGQTNNIQKRKRAYLTLNCKGQFKIYNSIRKYGWDSHKFEIVTECILSELNELERYYQELYNCLGKTGLNCILTETENEKRVVSQETKDKISKSRIGTKLPQSVIDKIIKSRAESYKLFKFKVGPNKGYKLDEERKKNLNWSGRKHSEASKEKIRQSKLGMKLSDETKAKINPTGRKHSQETKEKMSISSSGKVRTKSHCTNISISKGTLVINTETGIFYNSIREAADSINLNRSTLNSRICRLSNTSFKYA